MQKKTSIRSVQKLKMESILARHENWQRYEEINASKIKWWLIVLTLSNLFSIWDKSAKINSKEITSTSLNGSTFPSTWIISSSTKQRTTCTIASVIRIFIKNLLPRPAPSEAPFTIPAISTNSIWLHKIADNCIKSDILQLKICYVLNQ